MHYVVKSSDGRFLEFCPWTGEAKLLPAKASVFATLAYSEQAAYAMICDIKGRWPNLTFTVHSLQEI